MGKPESTESISAIEMAQREGFNQRKRRWYEQSSLWLGHICLRLGMTPNFLTGLSLVCAMVSGICFWRGQMLWGVVWIVFTGFTDMLDGSTARASGKSTVFGGILDHVSDRFGEFFVLAGITLSGVTSPAWGLFALFGMLIASYVRSTAESIGKLENCAVGIMGRTEKFIVIMIGALIEHFVPTGRFPKTGWLEIALVIVGATSIVTAIQRMVFAWKALNGRRQN